MTALTAMIPVRIGSQRLRRKNLVEIRGRPLMSYAIEAALASGAFDRVVVNGDDPVFRPIAEDWGAEFYLRPTELGGSDIRSDFVVADFLGRFPVEAVAWVNTTTPLLTASDIRSVITEFANRGLDSMITSERRFSHAMLGGEPLNFRTDEAFAKTQDLPPVDLFNYAVMAWKRGPFLASFNKNGHAMFCGTFGTVTVSRGASLMVKMPDDLILIEAMMALGDRAG